MFSRPCTFCRDQFFGFFGGSEWVSDHCAAVGVPAPPTVIQAADTTYTREWPLIVLDDHEEPEVIEVIDISD